MKRRPGVICGDRAAGLLPPVLPALLQLPNLAADTRRKSNGLRAGQRPSSRCYGCPLSWGFRGWILVPGADRGQDPGLVCVCAGHRLAGHSAASEVLFEFMPLSSAPGRIRTCAHGSGGRSCSRLLPGQTCAGVPFGERMGRDASPTQSAAEIQHGEKGTVSASPSCLLTLASLCLRMRSHSARV